MIKKCMAGMLLLFIFACSNNKSDYSGEKKVSAEDFKDLVFTAEQNVNGINNFVLFSEPSFGSGGGICEVFANEMYTSKYGNGIEKGVSFKIGNPVLVPNTDGYGNSGTKLILNAAPPHEGLVIYCYAFDGRKKHFNAIDKEQIKSILAGTFTISDK